MEIDDQPMDVDVDYNINNPKPLISWVPPPSYAESATGLYHIYTDGEGSWVIHEWKSTSDVHIESFHARWPPSRTNTRGCYWIAVNCGISPASRALGDEGYKNKFKMEVEGLRQEFAQIVGKAEGVDSGEGRTKVAPEVIDMLAVKYGVLSGKWLVYAKPDQVDDLWGRVVRAVAFKRGHGNAKVSARKVVEVTPPGPFLPPQPVSGQTKLQDGCNPDPSEGHVICVYVEDYTDKRDVDELRKVLRYHAGVFWKIGFKPDAYTYLGIYQRNPWGLRPSRYHDSDQGTGGGGLGRIN